jgi:hypothetical protein
MSPNGTSYTSDELDGLAFSSFARRINQTSYDRQQVSRRNAPVRNSTCVRETKDLFDDSL